MHAAYDIESIFRPGTEILLARGTADALGFLREMPESEREVCGRHARERVLREHTAASLHGLQRVGGQVHGHLVQMGRIAGHCGVSGLEPALEAYPGRHRGPQQLERFLDD